MVSRAQIFDRARQRARSKPRGQRVTSQDKTGAPAFALTAIGVVHSPHVERVQAPRQPRAAEGTEGRVELLPGHGFEDALADIALWDHLWLVVWFHKNVDFRPKVQPPRSDKKRGVFATRAPYRPNPIGISAVRLLRVAGLNLFVSGLDLLDGTPVLDRDYVTSYAERSWGDEDAAESFTTYVMLTALPEPADALATAKVRWFDEQPDYAAWRSMIRITEGEGPGDSPSPAPRAVFPFEVDPPMWIYGTWQGTRSDGVAMEYRFAAGSIVAVEGDGAPIRYEALRDDGTLATATEHTSQDGAYSYTALGGPVGGRVVHTRRGRRDDGVPRALRRSRGARAAPLWRVRRWARAARSRCRPPRCGPARRTSAVSGRSCDPRRCGRPARRRRRVCPPRRRPA